MKAKITHNSEIKKSDFCNDVDGYEWREFTRNRHSYSAWLHYTDDATVEFWKYLEEKGYMCDCLEESEERGYNKVEWIWGQRDEFDSKKEFMEILRTDVKKACKL